jgi:hypothetical protein
LRGEQEVLLFLSTLEDEVGASTVERLPKVKIRGVTVSLAEHDFRVRIIGG